jgi:hypothetical protein
MSIILPSKLRGIDSRSTNQSLNVVGIERQGTLKKEARLRQVFVGHRRE